MKEQDALAENNTANGKGPELLQPPEMATQSIDLDSFFTREVTTSGSFDLRRVKDISFGRLLEAIPIPTLLIDPTNAIVFANEAIKRIAGEEANLVGAPLLSLFPARTAGQSVCTLVQNVFTDRKTRVTEGLLEVGGRMLWCKLHFRSIRFRKQRSVLALVEDLTAEKKQIIINEKYQQLVQIFPIGIAEFSLKQPLPAKSDPEGILWELSEAEYLGGNQEFSRLNGRESADELRGGKLGALFPFGDRLREVYRCWIEDRFPPRSFETKEPHRNGEVKYFENTLVGNVKDGLLVGLWVMRKDITRRKESEEALRTAHDELEAKVKERTSELLHMNRQLEMEVVDRRRAEEALENTVDELRKALAKLKTLSGLLPICASCKKIRDDRGYWTQVEVYVRDHSDADFTHSICPDCATRLYGDFLNPGR